MMIFWLTCLVGYPRTSAPEPTYHHYIYIGLQFYGVTVTQPVVVGEWSLAVLLVARTFVVHLDDEYWRLA